jgi:hypothetical protein
MRTTKLALGLLTSLLLLAVHTGCIAGHAIGGMMASYEATGESMVFAEYQGLQDKTFAVIVVAPRSIQGEHPRLVSTLTNAIGARLAGNNEHVQADGFVPGPRILEFQYTTPQWTAWSYQELIEHFGVDRLIVVDLFEYRLREQGNRYVWNGRIAGRVGVIEAETGSPNEFMFTRDLRIRYPDDSGYTSADFTQNHVEASLQDRFSNRVSWLFFDHMEPNRIRY